MLHYNPQRLHQYHLAREGEIAQEVFLGAAQEATRGESLTLCHH